MLYILEELHRMITHMLSLCMLKWCIMPVMILKLCTLTWLFAIVLLMLVMVLKICALTWLFSIYCTTDWNPQIILLKFCYVLCSTDTGSWIVSETMRCNTFDTTIFFIALIFHLYILKKKLSRVSNFFQSGVSTNLTNHSHFWIDVQI